MHTTMSHLRRPVPGYFSAAALALLASACALPGASSAAEGAEAQVLVLADGAHLSGHVLADEVVVPAGVTVWADDDLVLEGRRKVLIEGSLLAADAELDLFARADGVSLALVSDGVVFVEGRVQAGNGRGLAGTSPARAIGLRGGDGGWVRIVGGDCLVVGEVVGGSGGQGGPGGAGGTGGDVVVQADALDPIAALSLVSEVLPGTLRGGAAGEGGAAWGPLTKAGAGGRGGEVAELRAPRTLQLEYGER